MPREKRSPAQRRVLVELMIADRSRVLGRMRRTLDEAAGRRAEVRHDDGRRASIRARRARRSCTWAATSPGRASRSSRRSRPSCPRWTGSSPGNRPDRMDLARWLVDRRNPLTARVAVNRIWQAYFGRGLVETDNDFGTQGSPPSHPELLDWLACELMDRGWSLKAIHRLIVELGDVSPGVAASAPTGQAVDPDNRLLWRQSRLRLDAELIRDAALAEQRTLDPDHRRPERLPAPARGRHEPGPDEAAVAGRYRAEPLSPRALHLFWRATPYPFLTTFDAPGGVQACTRRLRSDTPLQALTLLNDPAFVEIARGLAARILADRPAPATDRDRLGHAFLLCLGRRPAEGELRTLETFLRAERARGADADPRRRCPRGMGRHRPGPPEPRRVRDARVRRLPTIDVRRANRSWPAIGMRGESWERALRDRTRRHFFADCGMGLGAMALASLLGGDRPAVAADGRDASSVATPARAAAPRSPRSAGGPAGAFPGPGAERHLSCSWPEGPASSSCSTTSPACRSTAAGRSRTRSSRAAGSPSWTSSPGSIPGCWGRPGEFARHGQSGAWVSELLPHLAGVVDDLTFVKSAATDVFNHAPAKLFANTGTVQFGRPSMGSWITYGIGSESSSLPGFVVLQSGPRGPRGGAVNWASGFLPSSYQGVPLRVRRRSDPQPGHAAGDLARAPAPDDRGDRGAEPGPPRRHRRPRDRDADQRLRGGLPDADQRPGADRPGLGDAPRP